LNKEKEKKKITK